MVRNTTVMLFRLNLAQVLHLIEFWYIRWIAGGSSPTVLANAVWPFQVKSMRWESSIICGVWDILTYFTVLFANKHSQRITRCLLGFVIINIWYYMDIITIQYMLRCTAFVLYSFLFALIFLYFKLSLSILNHLHVLLKLIETIYWLHDILKYKMSRLLQWYNLTNLLEQCIFTIVLTCYSCHPILIFSWSFAFRNQEYKLLWQACYYEFLSHQ